MRTLMMTMTKAAESSVSTAIWVVFPILDTFPNSTAHNTLRKVIFCREEFTMSAFEMACAPSNPITFAVEGFVCILNASEYLLIDVPSRCTEIGANLTLCTTLYIHVQVLENPANPPVRRCSFSAVWDQRCHLCPKLKDSPLQDPLPPKIKFS